MNIKMKIKIEYSTERDKDEDKYKYNNDVSENWNEEYKILPITIPKYKSPFDHIPSKANQTNLDAAKINISKINVNKLIYRNRK